MGCPVIESSPVDIGRAVQIYPRDAAYDGEWAIRELYVQLSDRQSEAVSDLANHQCCFALLALARIEQQALRPDSTS